MACSYCSWRDSALFVPQGVALVCQPGRCSYPPGRGDEGLCRERRSPPGFETFPGNSFGPISGNPLLFFFSELDERAWKERTDVTGMAAAVEAAWDTRQATDSEQAIEAALCKVVHQFENLRMKICTVVCCYSDTLRDWQKCN